jgi:RNA polymerase sigma factor (sigma-70 family)
MPTTDATVVIVDDDSLVRRGVSRLARAAGFTVKTFASPKDFLRYELPQGPTCVLLDMCMDEMTGLDVQDALRKNARQVPVVFLSGHGNIPMATTTIKHGADDFLEKPFRPKDLMEAIGRAVERDRSQSADRSASDELKRRYDTLTPREQEVMALVIAGLLNKQIAAELGISEKTVKVHRARVMEKMQVEALAVLVRMAERLGIDATPPADELIAPAWN